MIIWPELIQGSEKWFAARTGRPTASNFSRIITPTGLDSSQWEDYALELMADCIRPDMMNSFAGNKHTDRGNELEPEAREVFKMETGLEVEQVGFVTRDDGVVGCSPDGFVWILAARAGGLELKSPLAKNHACYLAEGILPPEYKPQVHGGMAVTGLRFWYFMSYCQGMAPFIIRVEWDEYTDKVADALDRFLIFYADMRKKMMPLLTGKAAA